jgi:hypothetical protein
MDMSDTVDDPRYEQLLARYRDGLTAPGAEVRRRVMAELQERHAGAARRAWWRWLVQPHTVQVRPMLAAAALVMLVGLTTVISQLVFDGNGVSAPPGTVLVRFELELPQAETVALAGTFNDWDDRATLFTRSTGSNVWSVTIPLPPGEHEYLFVVNGERWIPDPAAHAVVDDGFGNLNSMIVVGPRGVVRS